jgi:hypothetical protein
LFQCTKLTYLQINKVFKPKTPKPAAAKNQLGPTKTPQPAAATQQMLKNLPPSPPVILQTHVASSLPPLSQQKKFVKLTPAITLSCASHAAFAASLATKIRSMYSSLHRGGPDLTITTMTNADFSKEKDHLKPMIKTFMKDMNIPWDPM